MPTERIVHIDPQGKITLTTLKRVEVVGQIGKDGQPQLDSWLITNADVSTEDVRRDIEAARQNPQPQRGRLPASNK